MWFRSLYVHWKVLSQVPFCVSDLRQAVFGRPALFTSCVSERCQESGRRNVLFGIIRSSVVTCSSSLSCCCRQIFKYLNIWLSSLPPPPQEHVGPRRHGRWASLRRSWRNVSLPSSSMWLRKEELRGEVNRCITLNCCASSFTQNLKNKVCICAFIWWCVCSVNKQYLVISSSCFSDGAFFPQCVHWWIHRS